MLPGWQNVFSQLFPPFRAVSNISGCRNRSLRFISTAVTKAFNEAPSLRIKFDLGMQQKSTGVYGHDELVSASGFRTLTKNVIRTSESLVKEALAPNSRRKRTVVEVLDDLSNTICRIADMAECVRNTHPKSEFVAAAEQCLGELQGLVERLNTMQPLYDALKTSYEHGDVQPLTEVDRRVSRLLLDDFENSGVNLNEANRKKFVDLTQEMFYLSSRFSQNASKPASISKHLIPSNIGSTFSLEDANGNMLITHPHPDHPNQSIREWGWRLFYSPIDDQETTLKSLINVRNELAQLCGFESFAHRALRGTMVGSPENAIDFLEKLAKCVKPLAAKEYSIMQKFGRNETKPAKINIWDVPYLSAIMKNSRFNLNPSQISSYFSLGTIMHGLGKLLNDLFSIELRLEEVRPGELWHDSVKKLGVHHKSDGLLGNIYCDFLHRQGKLEDCHFTIQGGRQQPDGSYQHPIITVVLGCPHPSSAQPSMLNMQQAENLFHEMGHALHSMLGRTKYQHVTGTRCPTDFAEIPSNLLEYFIFDPRVLKEVAIDYRTGDPMPKHLVQSLCDARFMFEAHEVQTQVLYALFDMQLHLGASPGSTMDLFSNIHQKYHGLDYVSNTAWHHRFTHLLVYGAKYYSYLVARAVASLIWQQCFSSDPFSPAMGERYRREFLAHGGERPPMLLVENMLGYKPSTEQLVEALLREIERGQTVTGL